MKKSILLLLAILLIAIPSMAAEKTLAEINAAGKDICIAITKQLNEYIAAGNAIPETMEQLLAVPVFERVAAVAGAETTYLFMYEPGWINNYGDVNPFTLIVCARFGSQCFITTSTTMETKTVPYAKMNKDIYKTDRNPIDGSRMNRIEIVEKYKGFRIINSWYY